MLTITGSPTDTEISEAWEEIVKKNQEANGSNRFDIYFTNSQTHALLINEYLFVKASLCKLSLGVFEEDRPLIEELKAKGYKLDISTKVKFYESVVAAFKKSENLITQTIAKKNEIDRMAQERGKGSEFEEIMAQLNYAWPNPVSDDIKLSTYNEYQKILRKKNAASKNKRNGRT